MSESALSLQASHGNSYYPQNSNDYAQSLEKATLSSTGFIESSYASTSGFSNEQYLHSFKQSHAPSQSQTHSAVSDVETQSAYLLPSAAYECSSELPSDCVPPNAEVTPSSNHDRSLSEDTIVPASITTLDDLSNLPLPTAEDLFYSGSSSSSAIGSEEPDFELAPVGDSVIAFDRPATDPSYAADEPDTLQFLTPRFFLSHAPASLENLQMHSEYPILISHESEPNHDCEEIDLLPDIAPVWRPQSNIVSKPKGSQLYDVPAPEHPPQLGRMKIATCAQPTTHISAIRLHASKGQLALTGQIDQVDRKKEAEDSVGSVGQALKKIKLTSYQQHFVDYPYYRKKVLSVSAAGTHRCPVPRCSRKFNKIGALVFHIQFHKEYKKYCMPFKCVYKDCPWHVLGFKSRHVFNRHVQSIHESGERFSCERCGKEFKRKDGMLRHYTTTKCIDKGFQAYEETDEEKLDKFFTNIVVTSL